MLLLAMCDPNEQGAPPRSPLGVATRQNETHLLEVLLAHQADPHLREAGQELPLIIAASRGARSCVQILLACGADPCATEYLPTAVRPEQIFSPVRRRTAMEVASQFPEVVEALQMAITAASDTTERRAESPCTAARR